MELAESVNVINSLNEPKELDENLSKKVIDHLSTVLDESRNKLIKERTIEDPRPMEGEILEISADVDRFMAEYFARYDIPIESINRPDYKYVAKTRVPGKEGFIGSEAYYDTILVDDTDQAEDLLDQDRHKAKLFRQSLHTAHETYHITAGSRYELNVRDNPEKDGDIKVDIEKVKSGLGVGETVNQSTLEEGMTLRFEEVVNTKLFSERFINRSVTEFRRGLTGYEEYLAARMVVNILEQDVPDFVRLAERARVLDEVDQLQEAVDKTYGSGVFDKIIRSKLSDSVSTYNYLYRVSQNKKF